MATATTSAEDDFENPNRKLDEIFLDGWKDFEELEVTELAFNSNDFQQKVKTGMDHFENATRIVSQIGMFSSNELIDEVSTESLQYMLLPYFLGKLALKLNQKDRLEVLNVVEVYFKDYLKRCEEYDLCDAPQQRNGQENGEAVANAENSSEMAQLMRAAHSRNDKIAQFRRKKELDEQIKLMKEAVRNNTVDEEVRREFFLNFLKKSIIDANEELDSLKLEKQMVEMHKMHMSSGSSNANTEMNSGARARHSHAAGHQHQHQHAATAKSKPLQPFIITRDATQKAVFGMGYPSLPVMTVGEFYQQRVEDGIFPDEEKVAKMNQAQAIAAAQDPNEKEDEEQAVEEVQIENDDPEYLARTRRMDEYKDVVRRGDGNRYNRS